VCPFPLDFLKQMTSPSPCYCQIMTRAKLVVYRSRQNIVGVGTHCTLLPFVSVGSLSVWRCIWRSCTHLHQPYILLLFGFKIRRGGNKLKLVCWQECVE
jgi:hypothetical protein